MTHDDATLLRRFAVEGSESAFSELVARYLDLVYAAALRQVNGDSGLAADICQSVFIDLARKARSLRPNLALAAWLHRATRLAALAALRSESRRAVREQEAAIMRELDQPESSVDWAALRPVIDAALDDLNEQDREAVLLRYFRQQPLREVAEALGLSENAARMRVDRALDKLRDVLARRGLTSTTSALSVALAGQALTSAPAGLAATLSTTAVSAAAASTASTLLMASMKLKLGVAAVVAAAVSTPLVLQHNENIRLLAENGNLKMQTTELERLRRENAQLAASRVDASELARLRAQQSELMRLRGEVGALREQARKLNTAAAQKPTPSSPATAKASPEPEGKEFISADKWTEVGADTPERAFQSFLAVLKAGDAARIASTVHWDVQWKDEITDDDKKLVEKSMHDYLDMLQRAPNKLAAFRLSSVADAGEERKRVYFSARTGNGTQIDSSLDMAFTDGGWKPVLSMRWLDRKNSSSFATSPVFGPEIDLEP
jgi:RNA polymerase sigma factor (sigma-70 family)